MGRHAFSTVASGSFGIVMGVLLDVMVVALFGMSWHTDAYFIAVTIPLVIITLMMLQATRVVQPLFINKRQTQGEPEGWNYLNRIMTGGTAIVVAFSAVGVLLSPLLMRLQAAGSPNDEVLLATRLSMYLFLILPLSFPVVVMQAALQSLGIFALTGGMKFFESCFKILLLLSLGRKLGVEALVLGTLAGTLFEILVFYLVLRHRGFRFHSVWRFKHPDIIQAYGLMIFPLAGQACAVGVESLTNTLGSMLGPGNVTALRLATRIIESFAGLLAGSIVTAAIPMVAASVANRDPKATRKHLQHGLYLLLLVTIPFSVWLGMMNRPLVALLYERANFSAADTTLVANILLLMIPYVFFGRFRSLLELPFFAEQDTRTPLLAAMVSAVLFVATSFFLVHAAGVYGVPLGRSFAYVVGAWFLLYLLQRRMGKIGFGAVRDVSIRVCVASIVMALFIWLTSQCLPSSHNQGFAVKAVAILFPSCAGAFGLALSLVALRVFTPDMIASVVVLPRNVMRRVTALMEQAADPLSRCTKSGDYRLPGPIRISLGNIALASAKYAPYSVRNRFLQRKPCYQTFEDSQLADSQGLSMNKWNAMQMPANLHGKSVLDIGCADGFFCELCAQRGAQHVLGIDSALGRLMRARFAALKDRLNIDYRMDIFPNTDLRNKFDYVFCLSVLHHSVSQKNLWKVLVHDRYAGELAALRKQLKALKALTAPGGVCVIEIPYEYEDPSERAAVDFHCFNAELGRAGFAETQCIGAWDHNEKCTEKKDRLIYRAQAAAAKQTSADIRRPALPSRNGPAWWSKRWEMREVSSWTNGGRADVFLLANRDGKKLIVKRYRPHFIGTMLRDYFMLKYVSGRLAIAPRVLEFSPRKLELCLSYLEGQRLLEWVLQRYGDEGIQLGRYQSFHGLETDPQIALAFKRFRESQEINALALKESIRASYAQLHGIGVLHGSADPRNVIYDGQQVLIIDFGHSRPCLNAAKLEYCSLTSWFGITRDSSGSHQPGGKDEEGKTAPTISAR